MLGEPWVKTIQEEKKQQRHQILKKQMSQEKRWREKGPQDILFLAFKSRKKEKKKRLKIAAELPENPNVNGKLDLLWLCSAQTDVRLRSRCDGFRELRDSPAEQHLLLLPPTLSQNPCQETWQAWALPLEKSRQDRVIRAHWNSSRHNPTMLLERCQPSPKCQSPLNAFLGNTLWFPSPLLIP